MITEIGITAGEIWHFLDRHGKVKLSQLLSGIDKPQEITLMSLGWLAREGHVLVEIDGSEYLVSLRQVNIEQASV